MDSVKDIFQKINNLDRIPDAYRNWEYYRNSVTDFIIDSAKGGDSILILGAGECNDIDLSRLSSYFGTVYLADKCMQSMDMASDKYGAEAYVKKIASDFVGISDEAYEYFIALYMGLYNQLREDESGLVNASDYLAEYVYNSLEKAVPVYPDCKRKYDCVVSIGVHSQLLNMFPKICSVLSMYMPFDHSVILSVVEKETADIIRSYNDYVFSASASTVITGLEKNRITDKNEPGLNTPVHGAYHGIVDIEERCRQGRALLKNRKELIWELYKSQDKMQDKIYLMEMGCYEV